MFVDPVSLFNRYYEAVSKTDVLYPDSMVLSTVSTDGMPSSRIVLLKKIKNNEFYFFTNYESRKSKQIDASGKCSLLFHWRQPEHLQVRIEGQIRRADRADSEQYFETRPRGSQLGAWTSPQSTVIQSRKELEELYEKTQERFPEGSEIPCPEFWGGYVVTPKRMEFWFEGDHRLHERQLFVFDESVNKWQQSLLAP